MYLRVLVPGFGRLAQPDNRVTLVDTKSSPPGTKNARVLVATNEELPSSLVLFLQTLTYL